MASRTASEAGAEQQEPLHKRARLSSPPVSLSPTAYASFDNHEYEDDLRTPERDVASPSVETPRILSEQEQQWVELALQQGPPSPSPSPLHHQLDAQELPRLLTAAEVQNQYELMPSVQLASATGNSNEGPASPEHSGISRPTLPGAQIANQTTMMFPKFQRESNSTQAAWSSKSELALTRFIASEPALRDWTNYGQDRNFAIPFAQRFSDLTQGPSAVAIRDKIVRMDDAYHILREGLTAAAKDASVSCWTDSNDLQLLASHKSQHGNVWMGTWHDEVWLGLCKEAAKPIAEAQGSSSGAAESTNEHHAARARPLRAARTRTWTPSAPMPLAGSSQTNQGASSSATQLVPSHAQKSRARAASKAPMAAAKRPLAQVDRASVQDNDTSTILEQQAQITQLQSQVEQQGQMLMDQAELLRHQTTLLQGVKEQLDSISALLTAKHS